MTEKLPKKKRYYVISTSKFGGGIFYFQDLDNAMEMFKYLQKGRVVSVKSEMVSTYDPSDKEDLSTYEYYHHEEEEEPEYHLKSEIVEIFTLKRIKEIERTEAKKIKEAKAKKPKKRGAKKK